jgi:formate--tetrahydrofolate ligase
MSFTEDAKKLGAPSDWTLPVSDLALSAGAEYVVAIAGTTVLMPGLGKQPQAFKIDLTPELEITGIV